MYDIEILNTIKQIDFFSRPTKSIMEVRVRICSYLRVSGHCFPSGHK